jgi:hypothetical protein
MTEGLIERNVERWHKVLEGKLEGGLDEMIADDCVFFSPIVFRGQEGKDLTKMYLAAASGTFAGGDSEKAPGKPESKFRYRKEVMSGDSAVLEFETEIDGKYINGVDIMTFNDEGKIVEFKVMIRPLQAINLMHEKMKQMLEAMSG